MRFPVVRALLLSGFFVGCSFDRSGIADDLAFGDAISREETLGDVAIDTFVMDESVPEDVTTDSGTVDVTAPDADTSEASDVAVDTAPEVPVTGSLVVTGASPSALGVDLTTEGSVGWAHWGLFAAETFTRKSGSGVFVSAVTPPAGRWDGFPMRFSWSDGDPNAVASATPSGIYRNSAEPLDFSVSAGNELRELQVYIATDAAMGTALFTLTDSSAAAQSIALPVPGSTSTAGHRPQVVTARFRSVSPTARLTVRITKSSGTSVSLFAATLR